MPSSAQVSGLSEAHGDAQAGLAPAPAAGPCSDVNSDPRAYGVMDTPRGPVAAWCQPAPAVAATKWVRPAADQRPASAAWGGAPVDPDVQLEEPQRQHDSGCLGAAPSSIPVARPTAAPRLAGATRQGGARAAAPTVPPLKLKLEIGRLAAAARGPVAAPAPAPASAHQAAGQLVTVPRDDSVGGGGGGGGGPDDGGSFRAVGVGMVASCNALQCAGWGRLDLVTDVDAWGVVDARCTPSFSRP